MRAFFCLEIDKPLNRALAALAAQLRAQITARVAWVPARNFHVTLRFLGEIDPMLTLDLKRMAHAIAAEITPFDLTIDRLGAFPSPAHARVIWAGGEAPLKFIDLVDQVNRGLAAFGFPPERKETIAHITLGRVKGRADSSVERVLTANRDIPGYTLQVDRVILMESALTRHGAVYNPLFSLSLTGGKNATV